jgi:hypothetical protein
VGAPESEVIVPAPRAIVISEAPPAPILLALYEDHGLVGRIELSPRAALQLAFDLMKHVVAKGAAA